MNHLQGFGGSSHYNPLSVPYNYKYNGKELQETGMYAMDWRHYMPDIGRFTGMDQLAEASPDWTPYRFAFDNPAMFSDPSGLYEVINGGFRISDPGEIGSFMNFLKNNSTASFDMMSDHIQFGGLYELESYTRLPEVAMYGKAGGGTGWKNPFGGQFGAYNYAVFNGKMNGWIEGMNRDFARTALYTAISDTKVGQSMTELENFLFSDIPLSFAGEGLFAAGWKALGAGKYLSSLAGKVFNKGTTVFRAVDSVELTSIKQTRKFLLQEGGTEAKYFAKSISDAHSYGKMLYPDGYSIVKGVVRGSIDGTKYWYPYTDGMGAYIFPGNILPFIKPIP